MKRFLGIAVLLVGPVAGLAGGAAVSHMVIPEPKYARVDEPSTSAGAHIRNLQRINEGFDRVIRRCDFLEWGAIAGTALGIARDFSSPARAARVDVSPVKRQQRVQ